MRVTYGRFANKHSKIRYAFNTRLKRTSSTLVYTCLILILALSQLITIWRPQKAAALVTGEYVALGDSYSAGQGVSDIVMNPGCHKANPANRLAWPYQVNYPLSEVFHRACSGATTDNLLASQLNNGIVAQGWRDNVKLVTVTIGGNDVGFKNALEVCGADGAANSFTNYKDANLLCSAFLELVVRPKVAAIAGKLTSTYKQIRNAYPKALVVPVTYPYFFPDPSIYDVNNCAAKLSAFNVAEIRDIQKMMNDQIMSAANSIGLTVIRADDALSGSELCRSDHNTPFFTPLVAGELTNKLPNLGSALFNTVGQLGLSIGVSLSQAQLSQYGNTLQIVNNTLNQQRQNLTQSLTILANQISGLMPERAFHPNEVGEQRYAGVIKPTLEAKYNAFLAAGGITSLPPITDTVVTGSTGGSAPVCSPGQDVVTLYADQNYGGACSNFVAGQTYSNVESAGSLKAATASSVKMGSSLKVYFCEGFNLTGRCEWFDRTDENIDNDSWGDRIRSLQVGFKPPAEPASLGDPTCTEGPDVVVFYENPNFNGTCVGLGIGDYAIAALYKPLSAGTMSSLKVGANVTARVCAQNNFVNCQTFGTDNDVANDGWADRMVSVKVEKTPPGPVCNYTADQAVIYDWPNYTGWCTALNIGDTVLEPNTMPGNLNDQIEAMKIGANTKIWACRDAQLKGICSMITSDYPDLSATAVGKQQISSYKVYSRTQPGPCDATYEQVVLFSDKNYDGACQVFTVGTYGFYTALNVVGDDNVESVRVMPGARVNLCRDAYLTGPCTSTTTDIPDLSPYPILANATSSLQVDRVPMQNCAPSGNQVAVYDLPNYNGDCTILEQGDVYSDLGASNKLGNNKVESVKVSPGRRVILCNAVNISGNCDQFNEDTPDLAGTRIGSNATVSLLNWSLTDCDAVPGTVVFYDKPNYQGLCNRQAAGDLNDASAFWLTGDNAVESVAVGDNVQLKLCTDMNQAGSCAVFRNNEPNLLNTPVGANAATSAKVEARTFSCDRAQYQAEYFNNQTLSGTPTVTRCETKPIYSSDQWGEAAPADAGVGADNFSARWTNSQNLMAGTYRIVTTSDDGVRIWVDNQLVIDKWFNQGATTYTNDVTVTSGLHAIKMEYYEFTGPATAILDLYPVNVQYTPPGGNGNCQPTEYNAEYFNNITLTGSPVGIRCEAAVNNDYGGNGPTGVGVGVDNFSVRWTNTQNYAAGQYQVSATADDGVRVWVDGTLLIDKWIDQGATTYTSTPTLTAGNHTVKMEYYEKGGGAVAKLQVTSVSTPAPPPPPPAPTPPPPAPTPPPPTPSPSPPSSCAATEYKAEYYNNLTLTGTAATTRCEAGAPNNDYGGNGPTGVGVGVDNFSVRWTNTNTYTAGTYRIAPTADDGVRVWVDNTLVIDQWIDQGATTYTSDQTLAAGSHTIKMEYYERGGGAVAKLTVTPVMPPSSGCTSTQWQAQYFNNITLSGTAAGTRCETTAPNYDWGGNGPTGVGVGVDNFSVRWMNTTTYVAGSYQFSVTADDGVRMWLDNTLLVDKWIDQGATTYTSTQSVSAGTHTVKIEYYEKGGGAVAKGSVTKL